MNLKPSLVSIRCPGPLAAGLLCALLAGAAVAQETNRAVRADYTAFRIVAERNIFNANRSGGSVTSSRGPRPASKVDAFRLVGVMEYDKGAFAFFDGTSSDYKKALQVHGKIASYTITNVAPNLVTLDNEGKRIELRVGMQVRRENEGEWQAPASGELPAASGSASSSAAGPSESSDGDSSGELSDVLKRLMQQKEKE
jgi:hypothetical protein